MGAGKDFVERIARERARKNTGVPAEKLIDSEQDVSHAPLNFLDSEETKATLPDGRVVNVHKLGNVTNPDAAIRLNEDTFVVPNISKKRIHVYGGTPHGYVLSRSQFKTGEQYTYHLVDINVPFLLQIPGVGNFLQYEYDLDAYAVAGLPPATAESGDRVRYVGFSSKGNHILVAGIVENDDRDKPVTLHWGIMKNWKINKDKDNPVITYTLEQGTKDLNREDFELAEDPGAPGPVTMQIKYERRQTGTGPMAVCPWNNNEGTFGATFYVTEYNEEIEWNLGPPSDPSLVELADPGADLNVIDSTFVFSETATGVPIVDFVFSFTSVYRRFQFYNLDTKKTSVFLEYKNDQYQVGCGAHCISTYTRERETVEEFMYGNFQEPILYGRDYTNDPCYGFNPSTGAQVGQKRTVTSSSETDLHCTREGAGTGDFCTNGEGDCTNVNEEGVVCTEGWPTCIYRADHTCPINPQPYNVVYFDEEGRPKCDKNPFLLTEGLNPELFNYSMLENTTQGIISIENLNSGGTPSQLETATRTRSSILTKLINTRDVCPIPVIGWPGPFTASGTLSKEYLSRIDNLNSEFDGVRYTIVPNKGFRDPTTGNTSMLATNTETGNVHWFAPYLNNLGSIGPAVNVDLLAATDQLYSNDAWSPKPDESALRATESIKFRTIKKQDPSAFLIKIRRWSNTLAGITLGGTTAGDWRLAGNDTLMDFITKNE